jgi:hypothetical protein
MASIPSTTSGLMPICTHALASEGVPVVCFEEAEDQIIHAHLQKIVRGARRQFHSKLLPDVKYTQTPIDTGAERQEGCVTYLIDVGACRGLVPRHSYSNA